MRQLRAPEEVWRVYWREFKTEKIWTWNYVEKQVWCLLSSAMGNTCDKTIAECGSGTGLVSLRISQSAGRVILIDISNQALRLSKLMFARKGKATTADFICASISALPFRDGCLDAVWSAGVMEHFSLDEQRHFLKEAWRRIKEGGKLIVILPNRDAIFYTILRIISIKAGRWPYGHENPLSRKDLKKFFNIKPKLMISRGFLLQFGVASTFPLVNTIIEFLKRRMGYQPKKLRIRWRPRLPGYLLMALWVKNGNLSASTKTPTHN